MRQLATVMTAAPVEHTCPEIRAEGYQGAEVVRLVKELDARDGEGELKGWKLLSMSPLLKFVGKKLQRQHLIWVEIHWRKSRYANFALANFSSDDSSTKYEIKNIESSLLQVSIKHSALVNVENVEDHKYEIVLEMRELASKGMAAEVVEEVNAMDPNFFVQNPSLLFQLKQVIIAIFMSSKSF